MTSSGRRNFNYYITDLKPVFLFNSERNEADIYRFTSPTLTMPYFYEILFILYQGGYLANRSVNLVIRPYVLSLTLLTTSGNPLRGFPSLSMN